MRRSMRSLVSCTTWAMARSSRSPASGSDSVTSTSVRTIASGVRSSCDALATNRRWLSKAPSRRLSIVSKVSASSRSSSRGPSSAMRSCSVRSDIPRAVAVMREIGRSARPASSQPAATEVSVTTASRPAKSTSTRRRLRSSAAVAAAR